MLQALRLSQNVSLWECMLYIYSTYIHIHTHAYKFPFASSGLATNYFSLRAKVNRRVMHTWGILKQSASVAYDLDIQGSPQYFQQNECCILYAESPAECLNPTCLSLRSNCPFPPCFHQNPYWGQTHCPAPSQFSLMDQWAQHHLWAWVLDPAPPWTSVEMSWTRLKTRWWSISRKLGR